MDLLFDNIPDDVLLCLLMHAGPYSALRMCSRALHQHGNDNLLWRQFVVKVGVTSPEGTVCSWLQVFKNAKSCSHARLVRDFRFNAGAKQSPDYRARRLLRTQTPLALRVTPRMPPECLFEKCLRPRLSQQDSSSQARSIRPCKLRASVASANGSSFSL